MREPLRELIRKRVAESYGSRESPDWGFLQKRYASNPYRDVLDDLQSIGPMVETTDLNNDRAVHLATKDIGVALSLIGEFALLQKDKHVLDHRDIEKSATASAVATLLANHRFIVLSAIELDERIRFGGDDATIKSVLFYE